MHAVIFDIDGTLLQSAEVDDILYRNSVRAVLGDIAFRPSLADYDRVTDSGVLSQIFDDNDIPESPQHVAAIKSAFVEAFRSHFRRSGVFPEIPGAKALLETISKSKSYSAAIATGGWRETAVLKLESAGFDLARLPLASSDDSSERSEIMRLALSKLDNDFESVTYYGDGPWDRDACRVLGWRFVPVGPVLGGIESYIGLSIA
ncbi:MAG: HAD hydrolase-like protein [Gammaproteobacteria bacterium]|nr:HAD hydrolase-like protein [Gammaproteobacteria bacterium]MDH4316098.1 HAD hydrolase-like protein [Gammaproteobacteria bacterium]MDH5215660.1 HAD hydrolase-like protein [Gammaproteobacteria bacterium]MDH5501847.1 HAD hydrolase-like protein [Gammaproteobacteria bacterium]